MSSVAARLRELFGTDRVVILRALTDGGMFSVAFSAGYSADELKSVHLGQQDRLAKWMQTNETILVVKEDESVLNYLSEQEREMLAPIRELADIVIDTTELTVHTLRDVIKDRFAEQGSAHELSVTISSFGFRHGLPRGLDMLFDVRFLPNPHFVPELRAQTGRDRAVIDYLTSQAEVNETIERFVDLLAYLLPRFTREGKSYLSIGVGCTGGRHRSVMIADAIHERLAARGFKTQVVHREHGYQVSCWTILVGHGFKGFPADWRETNKKF